MALTLDAEPELVFIKRAEHLNSHSGQVAFPGGMWEAHDDSLLNTALRESEEEISLRPDNVELIACLAPRETRFKVRVTPYVGLIPSGLSFVPEPAELDAVFQVPLRFLADQGNLTSTLYEMGDTRMRVPCFFYQQYCIWGFTLHLLADFLHHVLGLTIPLDYETLTPSAKDLR